MSASLALRAVQLGTVPLVSSLEALFLYSWLLLVVFLVLVRQAAHRTLGAFLVPLAAGLAIVAASWMAPPGEVNALFKNRWFALHTVSLFLGYSALSVAFCGKSTRAGSTCPGWSAATSSHGSPGAAAKFCPPPIATAPPLPGSDSASAGRTRS